MPICEGCSAPYDDAFKFCPQCGRPKPEPKKVTIAVEVSGIAHDFDCPLCGDASAVQKVSAIVSGNTSVSQGRSTSRGASRLYSERSGEQVASGIVSSTTHTVQKNQSLLAEKLSPPAEPYKPHAMQFYLGEKWWTVIGIGLYITGLFVTWPIGEMMDFGGFWEGAVVFFCLAPLVAGGGTWGVMALFDKMHQSKRKHQAALADYERDLKIYNGVKAQWDELYYCHKHDVVYTISKRAPALPEDTLQSCRLWASMGGMD